MKIKHFHDQRGLKPAQIAAELGMDERTVIKWLSESHFRKRTAQRRLSKLDPFRDSIIRLLELHPYFAAQVFQRIQQNGYSGGYTIFKDYVRKIRPRRTTPFLKRCFAPG